MSSPQEKEKFVQFNTLLKVLAKEVKQFREAKIAFIGAHMVFRERFSQFLSDATNLGQHFVKAVGPIAKNWKELHESAISEETKQKIQKLMSTLKNVINKEDFNKLIAAINQLLSLDKDLSIEKLLLSVASQDSWDKYVAACRDYENYANEVLKDPERQFKLDF